jgi:Ca2+-binding EF-hand superfamily protein
MFSLVLASVLFVFGIFLTNGATVYMTSHGTDDGLSQYYRNLFIAMATLFKAISGGLDWDNALEPLLVLPWQYIFAFYVYIVFSVLAMLNVISAMFIDYTLRHAKYDREFVVQTEIQAKREFMKLMGDLFEELDPDGSGTINLEEFNERISDPKVHAYFRALDLNISKVSHLFQLMDSDGSRDIDRKEFAEGCTRLRGEAKELDIAILQGEVKDLSATTLAVKRILLELGKHIDSKFDEALYEAVDQ